MQGFTTVVQQLLIAASCPICRRTDETGPLPCKACRNQFNLSDQGVSGASPLPWHALGWYQGSFRRLLLQVKTSRWQRRILPALMAHFRAQLALPSQAELVPIPSWKRTESLCNPLPQLIAQGFQRPIQPLLIRTRAGLSQHHLDRRLRLHNMRGAFAAVAPPSGRPIWLVDDILTTGATAMAAQQALQHRGHDVAGLLCLGRTPLNRR